MDPNLLVAIVGVISGLLGAFGGAAVSGWISWRIFRKQLQESESQRKLDNTFALHREFDGEVLNNSRTLAARLLESHPRLSLDEISEKMDGPETVHIWVVLSFYKRLALLLKHGQLDNRFVPELFGPLFTWWWIICYARKIPPAWVDYAIINDLWRWFQSNADKAELDGWIHRAKADIPRYLGEARTGSLQEGPAAMPMLRTGESL